MGCVEKENQSPDPDSDFPMPDLRVSDACHEDLGHDPHGARQAHVVPKVPDGRGV